MPLYTALQSTTGLEPLTSGLGLPYGSWAFVFSQQIRKRLPGSENTTTHIIYQATYFYVRGVPVMCTLFLSGATKKYGSVLVAVCMNHSPSDKDHGQKRTKDWVGESFSYCT